MKIFLYINKQNIKFKMANKQTPIPMTLNDFVKQLYDNLNDKENYDNIVENLKNNNLISKTFPTNESIMMDGDFPTNFILNDDYKINLNQIISYTKPNEYQTSQIKIKCNFTKTIVAKIQTLNELFKEKNKDELEIKVSIYCSDEEDLNNFSVFPRVRIIFNEFYNLTIDLDDLFKDLKKSKINIDDNLYKRLNEFIELIKLIPDVNYYLNPMSINYVRGQKFLKGNIKYVLFIEVPKVDNPLYISPLTHLIKFNYFPSIKDIIKTRIDMLNKKPNKEISINLLKAIDELNIMQEYCDIFNIDIKEFE